MTKIRLGCAVVATRDGRILLGRRAKTPFFGRWVIPGGGVNPFESLAEAAAREFSEETGLEIKFGAVATVKEIIAPPDEHRVIVYVSAEVVGGTEKPGSDISEVQFFERSQIADLAKSDQLTPTVTATLVELGWLDVPKKCDSHLVAA